MYRCNLIYNGVGEGHNTYTGQGLWFGNMMAKTLINPNQCRDFGIPIYDDLTDQHTPLGIEADFNTHIPMLMVGSTCRNITHYPTDDEIETCQHITVSDEHNWDPSKISSR